MKHSKHKKRLTVEQLEDRNLMSGMAWPGAQHLKVNFVPDGTPVDGNYQSALFSTLNAKSSTAAWQTAILQGLQAWAATANINIALVPGSAQADVRVAAHPMSSDKVALSTPYDPTLAGMGGEMVLNNTYSFG